MPKKHSKKKLLVILGPTASGKSDCAVTLAQEHNGEVISADSRQIYKGLDIGSGKITREEMHGIPHYLLDVVNPEESFSVIDFKDKAEKVIEDIHERNKLPILAGGTGQYIQAIVDTMTLPHVPPNETLRNKLEQKDIDELYTKLQALDPKRAETVDKENPRRLIRAIEVAQALGHVPEIDTSFPFDYTESPYNTLQIGLKLEKDELQERIYTRTIARLNAGWIEEVHKLHGEGVPWKHFKEFGLGYACIAESIQKETTHNKEALADCIATAEWQYAKRQMRWFKRDARIIWFHPKDNEKIQEIVNTFMELPIPLQE